MTPRPRKRGNKDLPKNLYSYATGYVYKHPQTGKRHGMGADRNRAIAAANILNQKLETSSDLVSRVIGGKTLTEVLERFRAEYLPDRQYSERTASEVEYRLKRYDREMGGRSWESITLQFLSNWLKPLTREAYRKHRAQWIEIYRFACSVGLAENNIAEVTLGKAPAERVRKRWTLEQYQATRKQAEPWLRIAMDLALISLQRREDLVNMRHDDIKNGRLLVTQSKTDKRLAIKLGPALSGVIQQSKSQGILCPYIIARKPIRDKRGADGKPLGKDHAFKLTPNMLTKAVAKARDKAVDEDGETLLFADYGAGERPTLHELRSLGAHLYREKGYDEEYIQALLGHATAKMTAVYLDGHKEVEYDEVSADLAL